MNKLKYIADEKLERIESIKSENTLDFAGIQGATRVTKIQGVTGIQEAIGMQETIGNYSMTLTAEVDAYLNSPREIQNLITRPRIPFGKVLREGSRGSCPNCGSTEDRKFLFFGKRRCISPECPLSRGWHN